MKTNFKKVLSLALILMMVVSTMVIMPLTASAEGASAADPFLISTPEQLVAVMGSMNRSSKIYVKLGADIDMTGVTNYKSAKYDGGIVIDGNNKKISNLTVTETLSGNNSFGGLIAHIKGASSIVNLTLENLTVVSGAPHRFVGGFFGYLSNSASLTMDNCHVSGSITSAWGTANAGATGGFVGITVAGNVTITNCTNAADIIDSTNATKPLMGGIVGDYECNSLLTIQNCTNTGKIQALAATDATDLSKVGQIVGQLQSNQAAVLNGNVENGKVIIGAESASDVLEAAFSVRLKLTDDFGFMAIAEGVEGFVFTTDAEADVATLDRVIGQTYNGTSAVYATYTKLMVANLDQTVYFGAYATVDGELQFTELKAINVYEVAKDLQDGSFGELSVTDDETEMLLYVKMCEYHEAYKAYIDYQNACKHVYDNACDADCNKCGEERTPAAHVYDHACDAACNECGATRICEPHVYVDGVCKECGVAQDPEYGIEVPF